MIPHIRCVALVAISLCVLTVPSKSFGADSKANENRIKKLTKDLKGLPNQAAPTSRVGSLVKKLVKIRPGKTTEYYLIGLRKAGQAGPAGDAFAKQLARDIKKLVQKADLSQREIAKIIRRVNKADRGYVPPLPPYSAKVFTPFGVLA